MELHIVVLYRGAPWRDAVTTPNVSDVKSTNQPGLPGEEGVDSVCLVLTGHKQRWVRPLLGVSW